MISLLKNNLLDSLKTVAPLIIVAGLLQMTLVQALTLLFFQFLAGVALVVLGMTLLFIGIDLGVLPMGRFIGAELPKQGSIAFILSVAFVMGFATTIAEPDVLVLTSQVGNISQGGTGRTSLLYLIAGGVGVFVALAMARIVYGASMRVLLTISLGIVILLSFIAPADIVPLAYDAGSVTTGVLTAPIVLALAAGLSSVLAGRDAISDGFGLLGFASIGPIVVIMIMGLLS
ncbi:DUF1538 domain-containing protein [Microvirga guangxiensis]|uniref:DUF1538 domain-containing protein n=1 Tax=Microvirga guangxiensis TaxID=549386 RepID=A0A1G5KAD5_9HYPH|nr:DUF1538 domain-containing protein [Microvirga guangxiensis]SCY97603.1 Protein of unknown function [Microvirga guangxiensis]